MHFKESRQDKYATQAFDRYIDTTSMQPVIYCCDSIRSFKFGQGGVPMVQAFTAKERERSRGVVWREGRDTTLRTRNDVKCHLYVVLACETGPGLHVD